MSYLSVNGICAGYGKQNVVENISFELEKGTLLGIIGANGSGKTTLLKAICGILSHKGKCVLDGALLETLSAGQIAKLVSYIPQRSGISIDISALDVVLMGFNSRLGLLSNPTLKMREAAKKALDRVGLNGKEEMNYLHLSEGQKQLCILARTLVSDSKLLILDEPESALDFRYRHKMLTILRECVVMENKSAIVSLHDPALALNFCDKLLLISDSSVLGIIDPQNDALDKMEQMLNIIYGPISLQRCFNRQGEAQLVMLREDQK